MCGKIHIWLSVAFAVLFPLAACSESEAEEVADDVFDVQFELPVGVETSTGVVSFTVIDHKNPRLTDSFILEPMYGTDENIAYTYPCTITETSPWEFTVSLSLSVSTGWYNVYVKRGDERKSYGSVYLAYVKVGEVLPDWFEGELDIHSINSGRGESNFLILPDGTTFLVDCSGALSDSYNQGQAHWRPNVNILPGTVVVHYISHFLPSVSAGHINYFLATHHHGDHIGEYSGSLDYHSSGFFRLTSVCEVGTNFVMDRMFDRDWPDFSYPTAETGSMMTNYKAFLDWTASTNKTVVEKWNVGSRTQVVPVHSSKWDVTIRNYAGSGFFWTGVADMETFTLMPTAEEFAAGASVPDENCFSCAFILSYGKFDYFNGGDLIHSNVDASSYKNSEAPLVDVVRKVEVMAADHHGVSNANSAELLNVLAPDVWYVGVWTPTTQPALDPINNVVAANPDVNIFLTYLYEGNIDVFGEENMSHIIGRYGHIVIRVAPGGGSYMVYMLEDTDEEYRVKSIHGPYVCGD